MASEMENEAFTRALMPNYPLDEAVDWIRDNLSPEDVFTEDQIRVAAQACSDPEDVFAPSELIGWAEDNGYMTRT